MELHCPPLNLLCIITCKHSGILRWKALPAQVPSKAAVCERECVNKCTWSHKNRWARLFNAIRLRSQLIYLFDDNRRWRAEWRRSLRDCGDNLTLGVGVNHCEGADCVSACVWVGTGGFGWIIGLGGRGKHEMENRVESLGSQIYQTAASTAARQSKAVRLLFSSLSSLFPTRWTPSPIPHHCDS